MSPRLSYTSIFMGAFECGFMASGFPRDYNWHLVIIKFGVGRLGMRRFRFVRDFLFVVFFVCLFVSLFVSLNRL